MSTDLQSILRSLCFNTEWKYAVFWKLKHRARMVLTWEDAYYENSERHNPFENKCFEETVEKMYNGNYLHDPLGLAVAKMSYHAFSLGEGIVGQVAVTGKYQWIVADKRTTSSISSFEFSDGWQSQLSAGIKTIVVVAVAPYGVVQLGSYNKVAEDMRVVTYIRDIFSSLQDSSVGDVTSQLQPSIKKPSYLLDLPPKSLEDSESCVITDSLSNLDKAKVSAGPDYQLPTVPHWPLIDENVNLIPHLNNENFGIDCVNFPSEVLDSILCGKYTSDGIGFYTNGILKVPESSKINYSNDTKQLENQDKSSHFSALNTFRKFSAGFELHEALGPAFSKGYHYFESEPEKTESVAEISEGKSISNMKCDSSSENLLEAIVSSVCYSGSQNSGSKSARSLLMSAEKTPTSSSVYSMQSGVQDNTQQCLGLTGVNGAISSTGFLSNCSSGCSERLDRPLEPAKSTKKRARPGENCKPRPRDRQLIQDRIKELRELVPNGAKCSIDSLLERTIKHMLFMESMTKHADKLKECAESKKESKTSSYEKGSSWAVEVGGHLKVSSIVVENLNKNSQMLVEMLCEDCSHFLEIAEAIRSLGLTILKGITEAQGDKTWICFMVEGENNRVVHRMDVLLSLMQILQGKTSSN